MRLVNALESIATGCGGFAARSASALITEPHQRGLSDRCICLKKAALAAAIAAGRQFDSEHRENHAARPQHDHAALGSCRGALRSAARFAYAQRHARSISRPTKSGRYVGKKDKHVRVDDPEEFGNQWIFVAMDEQTKLVPSFVIGKRTKETTLCVPARFAEAACR